MNIRKACPEDLLDLIRFLYQLSPLKEWEVHPSHGKFEEVLAKINSDENNYLVVAENGGKIVGTATLLIQLNLTHEARPYGHVENVVVDETYRGRGIGRWKLILMKN